ncbi:MAG: UDP-N-acetylmuramoyl-tripeptide--D-alanyl-D-alanine ligase [Sarcina sp.]
MLELNFNEIVQGTKATILKKASLYIGERVSTDTRNINKGSIFFALKGENFNGNKYAKDAIEKGATVIVIDELCFDIDSIIDDVTILKVTDTQVALENLAHFYRNKLDIKVIGVTGSAGKTSTKDIMAAVLGEKYSVFKTKGNFNNHIGLPLMILSLNSSYDIAILEMGMSNLNEIHLLADIARPEMAVITNVGLSHIENLKTRDNILKAKMEIVDFFNEKNTLIINSDDDMLKKVSNANYEIIRAGSEKNAQLKYSNEKFTELSSTFDVEDENKVFKFNLPMPGKHNINNFMLCYGIAKKLDVSIEEIKLGLENIEATSMRLDLRDTNGFKVLDDCYNSSPASVKSAIDVLISLEGNKKIAALGTMRELGVESEKAHIEIGKYAKEKGLDKIFVFGEYSEFIKNGFGEGAQKFELKQELIDSLKEYISDNDIVLVKASRGIKFEEIVKALVNQK